MKKHLILLGSLFFGFNLITASAQPGGPRGGFDGAMAKLFGDNQSFSATVEFHAGMPSGAEMVMPGKMAFLEGKSRFEMDMADMKGMQMPAQAAAQMKQMGMSKVTTITLPEKKASYLIYPDMKAYVETPVPQGASASASDYKSAVTKLGQETLDGHDCVKNKVVVTGPDGVAHESTVWNATDLKQFPVKIQMAAGDGSAVMLFRDVKLTAPPAAQFVLPDSYTKYADMQSLMMSRMKAPPQ